MMWSHHTSHGKWISWMLQEIHVIRCNSIMAKHSNFDWRASSAAGSLALFYKFAAFQKRIRRTFISENLIDFPFKFENTGRGAAAGCSSSSSTQIIKRPTGIKWKMTPSDAWHTPCHDDAEFKAAENAIANIQSDYYNTKAHSI